MQRKLKEWEVALRTSFGDDISTPKARRLALWHYHIFDHAFLRTPWTNFDTVAPGVYRSNQPTAGRFARYRSLGLKSILNLRGPSKYSPYLFEEEACAQNGYELVNAKIYARKPARADEILHLLDVFERIEKPFLMHCKSGADRAGFAAALWLLEQEGAPLEVAQKQLAARYAHLSWTKTGIVDHILKLYGQDRGTGSLTFRAWVETKYDPKYAAESFAATPLWKR
ncbi:MAG: tyrosine-protein phosphatase [Pseudomonadota bacterium]